MCIVAEVSFGDKANRLPCQITDMSSAGARLQVVLAARHVGRRMCLFFDRCMTSVECQVVWTGDGEVGVRFCSRFRPVDHIN